MRYILLNNGAGVFRRDVTRIKSKKIEFFFEGAPEECEVRFKHKSMALRMPLKNGKVTLDVSQIRGTLQPTVIAVDKSWECDSIFIGECNTGELFVATETCYGEKIAVLTQDLEDVKAEVKYLRKMLAEATREFKNINTYRGII